MASEPVTHRATLLCAGPDGQVACSVGDDGEQTFGEVEGTVVVQPNGDREWAFKAYECPVCGRTDGFAVITGEVAS